MNLPRSLSLPRHLRFSFRYSIALLLVALAVIPLSGASWFAVAEVQDARSERAQALKIESATTRLVTLIELQTGLLAERNLGSAIRGITDVGLSSEFVIAITGLDLTTELATSRERVDQLVDELEIDDVRSQLELIRNASALSVDELALRYTVLETSISDRTNQSMDSLLAAAGSGAGADSLVTSLLVLRSSVIARQAVSEQFSSYFAAQFQSTRSVSTELDKLASQRSIRSKSQSETERVAPAGSLAEAALARISDSPEVSQFFAAVDRLIAGGDSVTIEFSVAQAQIFGDVAGVAVAFTASSATTELYFGLVSAAGGDVRLASAKLATQAQAASDKAVRSMAGLIASSLLVTMLAIVAIGRPARRLAETARRISDGDSGARFGGRGIPSELCDAGKAINEAAANLELAERQAQALADGELGDPVLARANNSPLGESLQSAVTALASSLRDREDLRERMTHEATHDGLTQLANRNASLAFLEDSLARARSSHTLLAVLFIDLDGFKTVNDNNGHHAGDIVLWTMADRLREMVRGGDLVGRIGGDEFVVIAEMLAGVEEIQELATRILESLLAPVAVDRTTVSLGASIGIAISNGHGAITPTELLRDADLAVYKAKAGGRGRIELCDDELRAEMMTKADLERSLARAARNDEYQLYYQPIVEAGSNRVAGYEALIRWNRPGHGLQFPDAFIPFAELSDAIITIDRWVVQAAVLQVRQWDEHSINCGLPISVNISSRHLSSPTFVDDILKPLRDYQVEPTRIIIEVTESALLDDLRVAAAKLETLRTQGIQVSIDDFGSGYTSLAHLRNLPIDILKIDKSFTADLSAEPLVKLIIDIGHLLGARITAEGIETEAQSERLAAMGCDDLQGYLFGRPQPPLDVLSLFDGNTADTTMVSSTPTGM